MIEQINYNYSNEGIKQTKGYTFEYTYLDYFNKKQLN